MANLSQQRREKMLAFLETLKEQHSDDDSLIAIGEIEKELKAKKYGLVWEEHEEAVDVQMKTQIPVFTEVKEREICADESGAYNFLLEGDNLHSLYLLEKTHKDFIDIIYIDPPYNTGSKDFVYDDSYIVKEDGYRHSKWLSFMEKRLIIAKNLLVRHGVIFIHIDDNEYANLKLLCDSIFNEFNYLGTIIQNKLNAKNDSTDIQKNHEYILCYRKMPIYINSTKIKPTLIKKSEKYRDAYLEGSRYYYINDAITTRGEGGTLNARPNLGYTVYYNPNTLDKVAVCDYDTDLAKTSNDEDRIYTHRKDLIDNGYEVIMPPKVRGKLGCWTWSLDKFNLDKDNIIITGKKGKYAVKKRTFVSPDNIVTIDGKLKFVSSELTNSKSIVEFSTNDGTNTFNDIFNHEIEFNNPKNIDMIEYLISLVNKDDATILDFFAGSGTTGHAVLKLNAEDGGHRKFILCTNNENNICEEVTYERIKRVINGYGDTEGIPANLKYFKTDFVEKESEDLSDELLEHIAEMIELEHGIKVDNQKYVMIMTDEEMDEFEKNVADYTELKAVFVSQDILLSANQQKLLDGLTSYVIPNYYFDFELREAGELW